MSDKPIERALDVTVPDKPNAVVRDRPSLPPARYIAGDEIARGGMGRVALATDTLLERTVAVKQALTLDPELLRRFRRETKITARLEHPSIVPVYDAGTDGDAPFYVMRRVSGQPLSELIQDASFDARLALVPNLLAAAQAVAHAHSRGIVHRDIKPANILVGTLGETVVIDWGLAKVVDEPDDDDDLQLAGDSLRTRAGAVFGTPGFMSPGQLRGEQVGYSADVYALGASLYFLLSGRPPHHAPTGDAMMVLAAGGPPTPLAELVPGVPRELAAIVDSALAYGDSKYDDASTFAEDLRRFSTGQLVAAHHYSSRERVLRFLRRHRAAVAISLIAIAVIAVGAMLSVRRVLEERDRADAEAAEAGAARQQASERADQLTLSRARNLVDTNPTEALALLKDLDPSSRRVSEAHGVASAAMMRGVAWGMPGPNGATMVAELSPSGDRLLQIMANEELFVWDLNTRSLLLKRTAPAGSTVRGRWLGNKILVYGSAPPALLNPNSDVLVPIDLPMLQHVESSGDETVNVGILGDGSGAVVFDRDGRVLLRPRPGHRVRRVAVTGNGEWIALGSDRELVVLSRNGTEVAHRTGDLGPMEASQTNRMAVFDDSVVWELELGPAPKWTMLDTSAFHKYPSSASYRGDQAFVSTPSGHVLAANDGRLSEVTRASGFTANRAETGLSDFLYLMPDALLFIHTWGSRVIPLPEVMRMPRLAARRGVKRFVVTSAGVIVVYELSSQQALPLSTQQPAVFYDENTLLTLGDRTSWFDLATGKTTTVEPTMPGLRHRLAMSPSTGKVVHHAWNKDRSQLYEVLARSPTSRVIYDGLPVDGVEILADGSVVYYRDRTLWVVGTPDRALITLAAPIASVAPWRSEFVVVSTTGELARGSIAGAVARIQVPRPADAPPIYGSLAVSRAGDILVGSGTVVWKWGDYLEPVLTGDTPIFELISIGDSLLVTRPSGRHVLIGVETREIHELPVTNRVVASRGALGFEVNEHYHFVDLASSATWPSGIRQWGMPPILSPSGRRFVTHNRDGVWLWTIPLGSGPLRPRLDATTNAAINRDGLLTWPWLQR